MLIVYHGHSEFALTGADGFSLLTDPFDAHVGYPMKSWRVDGVTVSHGHGDHSFTEKALGSPALVDRAGQWMLAPQVQVTAIPAYHDGVQGAQRGGNLLMKIEMEGLTLVHLGDLGVLLTGEQLEALGRVDVLMIPVGGYYTIDGAQAWETVQAVRPRVVIPMHYRTPVNADWPIAGPEEFLALAGAAGAEPMPLLRITRGDLSQQPPVALLAAEGL